MTNDNYNNEINKVPNIITRFLWWCAGADEYFLRKSPKQDRVKYAGIGGIILCTGALAAFSGFFAAYTIMRDKKELVNEHTSMIFSSATIGAIIFGLVWGLIIFNLDRFIVSSTGKGDGTDTITTKEWLGAIPRLLIALILGVVISAPLEIKILETEIDQELSNFQHEESIKAMKSINIEYNEKFADYNAIKANLVAKKTIYESELKEYENKIDKLNANKEDEMRNGKVYGEGTVARAMQKIIDQKIAEKENFIKSKLKEQKKTDIELLNIEKIISEIQDKKKEAIRIKENDIKGYDGLLKRLQISHEISNIWIAILLVFLCIEMGPIIFKMMLTKGAYDYMVENNNHRINMENGIFKEDVIYEAKNGIIHMEKYRYLEVESTKLEKERKIAEQDKINEEVINQWGKLKIEAVKKDPAKFITEGDESMSNNNA